MRVLLYCDFALPYGGPDATRVLNFAKLIRKLGHDVTLLGVQYQVDSATEGCVDGFDYKLFKAKQCQGYKAYKRINHLEKEIKHHLNQHTADDSYDMIILSGVYYNFTKPFLKYSHSFGTKLIVNSVEWYDKNNVQFDGIRGKIKFCQNRIALLAIHKKMGNILAISSLLDDYYKARGCNTVTIPTLVDMQEYSAVARLHSVEKEKLKIVYAGSPGRKDYILNAVYALSLLSVDERAKIELHFYGPEIKAFCDLGMTEDFLELYRDNIVCHGRIPYTEVKEKIADADFTVLLRPDKRYANAGFPTKVGESMACGTPVIANITSDLGRYIIDGKTGIVCENETPEACAEGFRRAINLTEVEKTQMRKATYDMANIGFNYVSYADAMSDFMEKTI